MIFPLAFTDVFIPDGDDARRLAEQELQKPSYQAAKPTWFDQLATSIVEWIGQLFSGKGAGNAAPFALTLIVIVLVAALLVALLVWGRPRASRRKASAAELLGEVDDRTAAQLRVEADRSARAGQWNEAIALRYRAIARSLVERDVIAPAPGATAQAIARQASDPFPGFADRLHDAATAFDGVRYLGHTAQEADYQTLVETDTALTTARPAFEEPVAVPA